MKSGIKLFPMEHNRGRVEFGQSFTERHKSCEFGP